MAIVVQDDEIVSRDQTVGRVSVNDINGAGGECSVLDSRGAGRERR